MRCKKSSCILHRAWSVAVYLLLSLLFIIKSLLLCFSSVSIQQASQDSSQAETSSLSHQRKDFPGKGSSLWNTDPNVICQRHCPLFVPGCFSRELFALFFNLVLGQIFLSPYRIGFLFPFWIQEWHKLLCFLFNPGSRKLTTKTDVQFSYYSISYG